MKALVFPTRNDVIVTEKDDPKPGAGEIAVRVRASGVCHTDLEILRGNYGENAFPLVPGHEFAGEVSAIGPEVTGFAVGDRVVADPNIECGNCRACGRGWAHLCEKLGAYGVTVDGGFAEICVIRADAAHSIGDMSFTMAALAEPMGCVLNALSPLTGRTIENAAVFGAGPMGMMLGLALRQQTGAAVSMVDIDTARLALAEEFGFAVHHAGAATNRQLHHACDLTVDATGRPDVAAALTDCTANGGAALFFGVCPQDARIPLSPFDIFRRQLSIFGTHSLNHNIPEALAALTAIGPEVERLVTHHLTFEEAAPVMRGDMPAGAMKVQTVLNQVIDL